MLTRLPFISTIQGCSSIRHGVARRAGSFSRLSGLSAFASFQCFGLPLRFATLSCFHDLFCLQLLSSPLAGVGKGTYQHSMKYLKFSPHLIPLPCSSTSSFSFGIGCRTMYVRRSINPALGCISLPSAGKGKRCCATSSSVTPKLQTSEVMVYDCPVIRSGAM